MALQCLGKGSLQGQAIITLLLLSSAQSGLTPSVPAMLCPGCCSAWFTAPHNVLLCHLVPHKAMLKGLSEHTVLRQEPMEDV